MLFGGTFFHISNSQFSLVQLSLLKFSEQTRCSDVISIQFAAQFTSFRPKQEQSLTRVITAALHSFVHCQSIVNLLWADILNTIEWMIEALMQRLRTIIGYLGSSLHVHSSILFSSFLTVFGLWSKLQLSFFPIDYEECSKNKKWKKTKRKRK